MYKKLLVVGALLLGLSPVWAQVTTSTVNKCDNKKGDPIIYTEFDCPEGYELITEGWLSESNVTAADRSKEIPVNEYNSEREWQRESSSERGSRRANP